MSRCISSLASAVLVAALVHLVPASAEDKSIVVASTTSTQDSGLFGYLLPIFKAKTGIAVKVIAQGTGQALDTGAARRCRRGVRARQAAGGKIPRRRVRRETLRRDVQRLRADRAEDRSRRRQGQGHRDRAEDHPGQGPRHSSRAATGPAPMPPNSRSGSSAGIDIAAAKGPGTARSGRAWARRSTPPPP